MASRVLDRSTLPAYVERVQRLTAETPRQWGKMDATQTVRHLIFAHQMSLGEQDVEDMSTPILRNVLYWLSFRVFTTWPKGKIRAPDFVCPPPEGEFESEQALLISKMAQFVEELESQPETRRLNPMLGHVPLTRWSIIHGLHCDHHLRQFGV